MAVDEVIDHPRCRHAVDLDELEELIFFSCLDHIARIRVLALAFVKYLRGEIILRAKLVLNPGVIGKSQTNRLVALREPGFTSPYVRDLAAIFFPVTTQQIFETGPKRPMELLDLRRALIGDLLWTTIKQPSGIAGVCLDRANAAGDKLGAFLIRIIDVVEKTRGKLGNSVVERGEEALADHSLDT